jgi:hypothetical protein
MMEMQIMSMKSSISWLCVVVGTLSSVVLQRGEVAYMVFSQERDLGCVDIGATQLRVHGLLQRLIAWW